MIIGTRYHRTTSYHNKVYDPERRIDFDLITAATFVLTCCKKPMYERVFASNLRPQTTMSGLGRPTICKQLQLNVALQIFTYLLIGANYSEHTRLWRVVRERCQTRKLHRICGQIDVWSKQVCGLHANGSNISLLTIFIIIIGVHIYGYCLQC